MKGRDSSVETRTLALGALDFTVDVAGPDDGTPVLLLHGYPQGRVSWRLQLPVLAGAGLRCHAPDQRGYSPGARPEGLAAYGLSHLLGDALALMDSVGAERFHLVGHDWGGRLAWTLASRWPERVISLAVLSRPHPSAFADSLRDDPQQKARSGHHVRFLEPGVAQAMRDEGFAQMRENFRRQRVPDEQAQRYIRLLSEPGAIEAAVNWYASPQNRVRDHSVAAVSMPTMYVWGNADHTVGRYAAERTANYVSGPYRFEEIDGAGHFLSDEVPARVSTLLLGHLQHPGGVVPAQTDDMPG